LAGNRAGSVTTVRRVLRFYSWQREACENQVNCFWQTHPETVMGSTRIKIFFTLGLSMGHLYRLRAGWEGEHLAHYLLSRFSFVAQPTTVADDVGSDFYCTIFEILESNPPTVEARTSFAIQVKTNANKIEAHNKITYLHHLEIPFFLGVIDQAESELKIYSAEHFPMMTATFGLRDKLGLVPVEDNVPPYWDGKSDPSGVTLNCYFVCSFNASEGREEIRPKVEKVLDLCRRASANISSRRLEENIYHWSNGAISINAGPGSATHFRDNFYKRLAEAFFNFAWILENEPTKFSHEEFNIYEQLYIALSKKVPMSPMINVAHGPYRHLQELL
jgi:hypothetical protein